MNPLNRRQALLLSIAAAAAPCDAFALRPAPLLADAQNGSYDWSTGVIEATLSRKPDPVQLGAWGYAVALYLYGMGLVYRRTGDKRYLTYLQGWVDHHVSGGGVIDRPISALDYMLPGNLLLFLYRETGDHRYSIAAESIRRRLDTYPRTEDGGLWHALSRQHQLWLDGLYMSMPFLVRYGDEFNDRTYTCDEAVKQLLIYAAHLNDPATGLLFHAYDESGKQPWADPVTHHSSAFWCRAIGWYGMALVDVLELMPSSHPRRRDLIDRVRQLAAAYKRYQDPNTGLWYQVVNRSDLPGNWHETSSSCMYTYMLSRAMQLGYIPRHFSSVMRLGYQGVLSQLSKDSNGYAHISNICEGTNVGDLQFYLDRPRSTDDFHGLGAFLIMNEQLRKDTA